MLAFIEATLYGGLWSFLSGPRFGQRLAASRFGRWVERKAKEQEAS
jgi:hypothetical protein